MEAVISGRSGSALLIDGDKLHSIHVNKPGKMIPLHEAGIHFLFGDANDLSFLENVGQSKVVKHLEHARDKEDALLLALMVLDSEEPSDIRQEAAEVLNDMMDSSFISEHLESVFYARTPPKSADMKGAFDVCKIVAADKVLKLVQRIKARETLIFQVRSACDEIPGKYFDSSEDRSYFQSIAVREGLFKELVKIKAQERTVDSFLFESMTKPDIIGLRNYRQILHAWIEPLKLKRVDTTLSHQEMIADELPASQITERKMKHKKINGAAVFENVEVQKKAIVEAIKHRDHARFEKFVNELVKFHFETGGAEYAVKSLCDLAMAAKRFYRFDLQLHLIQWSIDLKPGDGWAWAQYGDALLKLNKFQEAFRAYDNAELFGKALIAKTGRAEVLKALYRLDEALAAYDEVIVQHPEEVVAKNGRAEVLKALYRLDEALAAYDEVIDQHPGDMVAKTGRAEVLKALNRLDEALAAYDEVIDQHSGDVVAKTGRAEVLKALNRLDEALAAYDEVIDQHPENAVAKNGRALVLAAMKKYDEALELLPEKDPISQHEWIGYHIRGMILLRMGDLSAAKNLFQNGINTNPSPIGKEYFSTALAVIQLKMKDYKSASNLLAQVSSPELEVTADILRVHAFGALGDKKKAAETYSKLPVDPHPVCYEFKEELRRRFVDFEEPLHDEEWLGEGAIQCYFQKAA